MASRRAQCEAGIDNSGFHGGGIHLTGLRGSYDRCRRRRGHVDGTGLGQWHLPDCGGAFTDAGAWERDWIPIFHAVADSGERLEGWNHAPGCDLHLGTDTCTCERTS